MTKTGYISNAAKLLSASAAFLLIANIMVFIGSFGFAGIAKIGSSLSSLAAYVVFFISYVAFNGEGIGHKRARSRNAKKATGYLKLVAVLCFASIYFKSALIDGILNTSAGSAGANLLRLFGSLVYTVTSYAFLFTCISFWYLFRDRSIKKLCFYETASFILSCVYNFYKLFNYSVLRFGLSFSEGFDAAFSNKAFLDILCIVQYAASLIMLVAVSKHYGKMSVEEEKRDEETNKLLFKAEAVYKDEGFGIDSIEDDFLTE